MDEPYVEEKLFGIESKVRSTGMIERKKKDEPNKNWRDEQNQEISENQLPYSEHLILKRKMFKRYEF